MKNDLTPWGERPIGGETNDLDPRVQRGNRQSRRADQRAGADVRVTVAITSRQPVAASPTINIAAQRMHSSGRTGHTVAGARL